MPDVDVAVIGAGCIGASVAKHVAEAGHSVRVLEKEAGPARHQSGRNSGVIHAGYNLKPGSKKAQYCVRGNREMVAYCKARDVRVEQGGILVVALDEPERAVIKELARRGRANGAKVNLVGRASMAELEPYAAGIEALSAPEAASVDARGYVEALLLDAEAAGADIRYGHHVPARRSRPVAAADVDARVVVNVAGLHADRLARAEDMRIVPFRGDYHALSARGRRYVRSHIYAAPDPRFPFLGIHLSRRIHGAVTAGPGALLAAGPEAYRPWQVRSGIGRVIAWRGTWRLVARPEVRSQIPGELRRSLSTRAVWNDARRLIPALKPNDIVSTHGRYAGVRAQLVDRDGNLVDDIVVREATDAVHVLNAVSPGLTCSLPFGRDLAARALALV